MAENLARDTAEKKDVYRKIENNIATLDEEIREQENQAKNLTTDIFER
jgi:hypothetical protein